MQHQARGQPEKVDPAIGFESQDGRYRERSLPELQILPRPRLQCAGQALVEPYRARRGTTLRRLARLAGAIRPAQHPAQGIGAAHRLDVRQLRLPARQHHARKTDRFSRFQTTPGSLVADRRLPRMIGNQQQVATDELPGFLFERQTNPVGEESDRRDGRHGDHQRGQKQTELT